MRVTSAAPTRVDLAGGTLDIWPLCHLLDHPAVTVNLAIDLCAQVTVEERRDGRVEVLSEDRGERVEAPVGALRHDRLGLATRLIEWFGAGEGLFVSMRSTAPPQSGLGGSSSLAVALAAALCRVRGRSWDRDPARILVQNVEAAVLGTPAGYQDYIAPLYGGLNTITATAAGLQVSTDAAAAEFFRGRLLLVDTGIPHHSGMNNWEVMKRFIDGDRTVRGALNAIARISAEMRDAVEARDLAAIGAALRAEWKERRHLSPMVTNARIDAAVETALGAGALGAKICGAGGGGCLAVLTEQAGATLRALTAAGTRPVDFRPTARDVSVTSGDRPGGP